MKKCCNLPELNMELPAVYDDALSYQQFLYKTKYYLCNINQKVDNFLSGTDVGKLVEEQVKELLPQYVDQELFDKKMDKLSELDNLGYYDQTLEGYNKWVASDAVGVKYTPAGSRYVNGTLVNTYGRLGNCLIPQTQQDDLNTVPHNQINATDKDGLIVNSKKTVNAVPYPQIAISSLIEDSRGGDSLKTCTAGIYSYVEQTGKNTRNAPKAVMGVSVNRAGGDNDSTGVVGYSYKYDVPSSAGVQAGIGDTAGAGGSAWQLSDQLGLVIGGEFNCHQNSPTIKTTANDGATGTNKSMALHLSTRSMTSPCGNAIGVNSELSDNLYGFWNILNVAKSCFNNAGVNNPGETTIINSAACTDYFPFYAWKMGNAKYHFARKNGGDIRVLASDLVCASPTESNFGIRIVGNGGGYLGFYSGQVDSDGIGTYKNVTNISSTAKGGLYLASRDPSNAEDESSMSVILSKELGGFFPHAGNAVDLGINTRPWRNVYTSASPIVTSDKSEKIDCGEIPQTVLNAWKKVKPRIYKMIDSVKEKGNSARKHFGYYAQDVIEAFESEGLDPLEYGIVCKQTVQNIDSVENEVLVIDSPEVRDDEGNIIKEAITHLEKETVSSGGDSKEILSLRYDEAFMLDIALLKSMI